MKAPIPNNDEERLRELYAYQILDTAEEKIFNTVVELAAAICKVPISSINLVDRNRQWSKAAVGIPRENLEVSRDIAFCSHTILSNNIFEVHDAAEDERFANNPSVKGYPYIRFYTGVPLVNERGFKLGSLCVIDNKPNKLTSEQKDLMQKLSEIVLTLLKAKKKTLINLHEKQAIADQLKTVNTTLGFKLKEVSLNNFRLSLLGNMNNLLLSCQDCEEAYNIIQKFCLEIFPSTGGAIYFMDEKHDFIELMTSWGKIKNGEKVILKEDCWALRSGKVHINEKPYKINCNHLSHEKSNNAICVPLMAQGETIGLLTLVFNEHSTTIPNAEKILSTTIGEQISIGIANIQLRQTLKKHAIYDALTQLYNRRHLTNVFRSETFKSLHTKNKIILDLIDIDHFKNFNDQFGHDVGDMVLQSIANQMKLVCSDNELPCRLGGEEFVILFQGATIEYAIKKAETLRKAIESLVLVHHEKSLGKLTISQGLALFPDDAKSLNDLLKKADDALYKAKNTGRNKVVYKNQS